MDATLLKAYYKKSESARWGKSEIVLDIPVDVFSSHQIDIGTSFLLRRMSSADAKWRTALDVGCGYGPIALFLASTGLSESVLGIDRDALAVAFAESNAARNGVRGVAFESTIAYDGLRGRTFDLVASNIPAKAGEGVHRLLLLGAREHLNPGGDVWIVAVSPLEDMIDAILDHENIELRDKVARSGHIVYRYGFRGPVPVPEHPYDRGRRWFEWKSIRYELQTWHGLPEFDTLSKDTELSLSLLAGYVEDHQVRSVAVWNPGHGHIPVILCRLSGAPLELRLYARDCLALQASRSNLMLNGFAGKVAGAASVDFHVRNSTFRPDLVVGRLNSELGDSLNSRVVAAWFEETPECNVIVSGGAAFLSRVERRLKAHGIEVAERVKREGFAATRLKRKRG